MGVYEDDSGNQHVSIQLSWTAASPADLDLSQYIIAWSQDNSDWQEMSVERTATSCRIFGLELGEGYYVRIKAVDRAGNESAWVNFNAGAIITMPSDTTAPSTPTGLTTYSRFKAVHLGWTNPTQKDLSHIIVHRSTDRDTDQDGTHDLISGGAANDKLAVQFTANTSIDIAIISLKLQRTGTPGGNVRVVVYDDAAGLPNAAIANGASDWLAASDVGAAMGWEEFVFSTSPSITATSVYHIVLEADGSYTYAGGVDEVTWGIESVGSGGTFEAYGGAAWANVTTEMGTFIVLVELAQIDGDGYTDAIGLWDSTFEYTVQAVDRVGNASVPATVISGNTDITAPGAPSGLSTTTATITDADGHIIPYIDCAWTDSVTEDVQSHEVETQYYISAAWQDPVVYRLLGSPLRISPVPGNVNYRVRVRALDDASLPSAWTAYDTGTTDKDNVAPATPSNLSVESAVKSIAISVDVPSESDWGLTEFYVSTTSGFTPGAGTLAHSGKTNTYTYPCTTLAIRYVRVRHGDTSDNWSAYVAEGSAKPGKGGTDMVYSDLVSCGTLPSKIYIHIGVSGTVRSNFSAPDAEPAGLAFDGENLISCSTSDDRIYKYSGLTSTVTDSFGSPGSFPDGLTFDPDTWNLISCDYAANKIYKHDGISAVILDSFSAVGRRGLAFDGITLFSCTGTTIYIHSGITSTIADSFAAPASNCRGLTYDVRSGNLISCDDNTDKIYIHAGVTAAILSNYASPDYDPGGLTWTQH